MPDFLDLKIYEISQKKLIENFSPYIIPFLKKKIFANQIKGKIFIILSDKENLPKSLLVFEIKKNNTAEFHSVFVAEEYRKKGIASLMMQKAEQILKNNKIKHIDIVFFDTWSNIGFIKKYIEKNNWLKEKKTVENFRLNNKNALDLDWVQKSLKEKHQIIYKSWGDITEKEKKKLQEKILNTEDFPHYLTPFQIMDRIELDSSQIAFNDGEIIGWSMIHILSEDLLQCSALYVFPKYRKNKISEHLIARNLLHNVKKEYKITIFQVQYKNETVRIFLNSIFAENNSIQKQYHTFLTKKIL